MLLAFALYNLLIWIYKAFSPPVKKYFNSSSAVLILRGHYFIWYAYVRHSFCKFGMCSYSLYETAQPRANHGQFMRYPTLQVNSTANKHAFLTAISSAISNRLTPAFNGTTHEISDAPLSFTNMKDIFYIYTIFIAFPTHWSFEISWSDHP